MVVRERVKEEESWVVQRIRFLVSGGVKSRRGVVDTR